MFPEALMLHYLDDLDSKMEAMRAQFQREAELDGPWTSYNASMGRPLLNSAKLLRNGAEAAADSSPVASESDSAEASPEASVSDLGDRKNETAAAGTTSGKF
jgi:3'-5' exoribonuclease